MSSPPKSADLTVSVTYYWGYFNDKLKNVIHITDNRIRETLSIENFMMAKALF